ncbi:MAG: low molecular weight phosphatase family protein [Acidobacteriota bacterium]
MTEFEPFEVFSSPPLGESRGAVLFLCTGNYYRSRFAELLFNHLAPAAGVSFKAASAGLAPSCWQRNPGPISELALEGLRRRGVPLTATHRPPRDASIEVLSEADLLIALKEAEHRPMLRQRFPEFLSRVRFWEVDDLPHAPAETALAEIESQVLSLIAELRG